MDSFDTHGATMFVVPFNLDQIPLTKTGSTASWVWARLGVLATQLAALSAIIGVCVQCRKVHYCGLGGILDDNNQYGKPFRSDITRDALVQCTPVQTSPTMGRDQMGRDHTGRDQTGRRAAERKLQFYIEWRPSV